MKYLGNVLFIAVCVVAAQTPQTSPPAATPGPAGSNHVVAQVAVIVKQQFGANFSIPAKFPTPVITADFDGDGVEDAVIVADSKDPLPDSYSYKYKVADPYGTYFGFGDPRLTSTFRTDPEHSHNLLVILGSGNEGWHAATPKAKFVLINVPFDTLEVGRMLVHKNKPPIFVIKALETRLLDSAVFWDAKKKRWRWQPGDTLE